MNADTARHEDMMAVEMPDMTKMGYKRGVANLKERYVFDSVDDEPEYEAPQPEVKSEPVPEVEDDVDLSDIELPDDDD
jgi:hypothetical protein